MDESSLWPRRISAALGISASESGSGSRTASAAGGASVAAPLVSASFSTTGAGAGDDSPLATPNTLDSFQDALSLVENGIRLERLQTPDPTVALS
jgi:hypothetical protein